ncbi:hemerythrin domain-containing protein [Cryobacterium sp. PH29-G1]|uniref:hemerythrin domain-containing protein n=1 Tax=Cryobacterium sp. PH29-G1 TaxID=3046211 RepID=UPI0024B9D891|nr:hemerythrin domain-containing protein [Cryobacterium sp. PH29-G1]MDJ0350711.1 hemerythrin domain-containing protein [Cryobacterium sp. PH29-G1]
MTDRERTRLVAWSHELRRVHSKMREALQVTQQAVRVGQSGAPATRELLIYCRGFCAALDGHHRGEDRALFPAIEAAHPHLAPVLRSLERDHSMLANLLQSLGSAVERAAPPDELELHLEGVAAIMENHFRYEERQLLVVLEGLELRAAVKDVLGPL